MFLNQSTALSFSTCSLLVIFFGDILLSFFNWKSCLLPPLPVMLRRSQPLLVFLAPVSHTTWWITNDFANLWLLLGSAGIAELMIFHPVWPISLRFETRCDSGTDIHRLTPPLSDWWATRLACVEGSIPCGCIYCWPGSLIDRRCCHFQEGCLQGARQCYHRSQVHLSVPRSRIRCWLQGLLLNGDLNAWESQLMMFWNNRFFNVSTSMVVNLSPGTISLSTTVPTSIRPLERVPERPSCTPLLEGETNGTLRTRKYTDADNSVWSASERSSSFLWTSSRLSVRLTPRLSVAVAFSRLSPMRVWVFTVVLAGLLPVTPLDLSLYVSSPSLSLWPYDH
jgi:hypothetical protein